MWKLSHEKLTNKANEWSSIDKWKMTRITETAFYIENLSNKTVLASKNDDDETVIEQSIDESQDRWIKWEVGTSTKDDYATLCNVETKKLLSADSANILLMKDSLKVGFFLVQRKNQARTELWAKAISRKDNKTGQLWMPSKNSFLCGHHFISGKPTEQPGSADYVPSIFTTGHISKPKTQNDQDRFERVQRRRESLDKDNNGKTQTPDPEVN